MLKKEEFLVFYLPKDWHSPNSCLAHAFEWSFLTQQTINAFFLRERRLYNVFKRFLAQGFTGIVWYNNNEWASYAWISLPETFGPPHLPCGIRRLPVYWVFYCRTKDVYRGRGLYKASLSLLGRWARERDPEGEIYIDTEPSNIPSRKAIEAVGFLPKGIITTWTLRVPRLSFIIWGRWAQNASHLEEASR